MPLRAQPASYGATLPVPNRKQLGEQLCWAAVAEMVMIYWNGIDSSAPVWSQCEQARYNYYVDIGVPPIDSPACVGDSIPSLYDNANTPFDGIIPLTNAYDYIPYYGDTIDWETIQWNIDRNRPVIVEWGWQGHDSSGSHFVVVDGYQISSFGQRFVSYVDPWSGDLSIHKLLAFNEFINPGEIAFLELQGYRFSGSTGYVSNIHPIGYKEKE